MIHKQETYIKELSYHLALRIAEFNSAYNRCVLKYQEDADNVTREIAKVNNPADVIEFKDWLKSFCSTLDEDKKYVLDLMAKGKEIIQLENGILAKLSKENKKIFPQIPQY